MYAIVEIAGQQFKVEKDQRYFVHQLEGKAGSNVTFDQVLLLDDNGKVSVGAPAVNGVQVTAKIVQHLKGDKVIVFKKKRRKGYAVKNGHRQRLTEISIQEIGKKAAPKKAVAPKKETVEKKAAPKKTATAKKATSAKSVAKKAAAPNKAAPKKAASKKDS
ncbi:MAG: 50S ribosomal protein L21 [Bacteroidota bacterium]|nr:50S ribosomal protein L21 [Bacteroidota bacterium]MEC7084171.1 50S ribosomal protein L21 [Bacteroidota bacterium]MEC7527536.1 50S ribosomal protein L21 [Bacteroidota bacterium]